MNWFSSHCLLLSRAINYKHCHWTQRRDPLYTCRLTLYYILWDNQLAESRFHEYSSFTRYQMKPRVWLPGEYDPDSRNVHECQVYIHFQFILSKQTRPFGMIAQTPCKPSELIPKTTRNAPFHWLKPLGFANKVAMKCLMNYSWERRKMILISHGTV